MRKKIDDKTKLIVVFLLLIGMGICSDITKKDLIQNGEIQRDDIGGDSREVELELGVENIFQNYDYVIKVSPVTPTKTEADAYFEKAITQIEREFQDVGEVVPRKDAYLDGLVEATWQFEPYDLIDQKGKVYVEKLEKEENVIGAQVKLICGAYEKIYQFSFLIKRPKPSEEELLLKEIEVWMEQELKKEGHQTLMLPTEILGKALSWSEKKDYLTPKLLLVEGIALLLLWVVGKRKEQEEQKKQQIEMEMDYPDLVNQLSLLLSAGMTTRKAFERIAAQYTMKRNAKMIEKRRVYESVVRMTRRLLEGESERLVYQSFMEEIPCGCYRKLMRILLGNLEQGTKGVTIRLEEECRQAFEQRILIAKKRGEEISTKMLAPLLFMLMLVMGIVILPALISFQI